MPRFLLDRAKLMRRGRMRIKIVETGRAVPAERVTTRALEATLGLGEGTLETVTGVVERYVCNAESQIDLACAAVRRGTSQPRRCLFASQAMERSCSIVPAGDRHSAGQR